MVEIRLSFHSPIVVCLKKKKKKRLKVHYMKPCSHLLVKCFAFMNGEFCQ